MSRGYYLLFLLIIIGNTVFAQTTWEFSGTPYSYQKAHFDSATSVVRTKLGVQMHTFGAPYNQIDATLLQVMSEDTSYKVLLFGQLDPSPLSGQINLKNRVNIEGATGVPDYAYFLTQYNTYKTTYTDYMVMQGHPYAWTTPAKLTEFQNIVNFLISEGVVFNTPYGYYKYLTDLSIPRTTKVQVILKLDDLRAATSYFYPCLPTYDFLVTNKVNASFGVNKLETLTQSQIDTLHYYLSQTNLAGEALFEIWNHGLDHSMTAATTGGNWSSPSSWPSGYVPTAGDDVDIPAGVTITLDVQGAVCKDLTISGTLTAQNTAATSLTVNGDVLINTGGSFTTPLLTGATANVIHTLTVYGDFTNAGGTFDFRQGSAGTTMRVMNTTFTGNYNSTVNVGTYSSSNNDFNGITINKSSGAKVICASDVVCDPGASTCVSQLVLTSGIVETGNNTIYALSTTSTDVVTPSAASYVNGALGRGMSNSAGKNNLFPVGDANGYRPISVRSTTAGTATGHHVIVRCIPADANKGGSVFTGSIDAVSKVRYYKISYNKGIGSGATSMSFSQFSPSYGADDGVEAGNTDLRVAYSTDERTTWNGMSQTTPHTTTLASPPTTITPTALTTVITLNTGTGFIYATLAKASGTSTNPLPVELTSFTAQTNGADVVLAWATAMEVHSYKFEIERSSDNKLWNSVGEVAASGNSNVPKEYRFIDNALAAGTYAYRLRIIDTDGSSDFSPVIEAEVSSPSKFSLSQNYPNPFNPTTTVTFALSERSTVELSVYTMMGERVAILAGSTYDAGVHTVGWNASGLASGIYFYELKAGTFRSIRKLALIK